MLDNKTILVTGGTGSFGKKFVQMALSQFDVKRILIYSRDELKQFEMENSHPFSEYSSKLQFFIGDVRDLERLKMAMENVDIVIHAAALKEVPACENNPFEAVKTNILGGENVILAALYHKVSRVIALSTDKAAAPVNLYGATKLASDKLFRAVNKHKGDTDIRFSVVRYGNVMGSRGSVIPFFQQKLREDGVLPITDRRMTRFNITLESAIKLVFQALEHMWGGEIFIPKIPSYRIVDVAKAVSPDCEIIEVGIRPGEKIHEEMITTGDSVRKVDFGDYYVIMPAQTLWNEEEFIAESADKPGKICELGFCYSSENNPEFLSVDKLEELIEHME